MRPMPPTSAAQVMRVLTSDARRVTRPSFSPRRLRIRLNTGCLATAATRPLISPNTIMPMVEKANAQISAKPKIEPACAANTSSLMSTKPPTAVMMPSVSSSGFKVVLDLLQSVDVGAELLRCRIVGLRKQRLDFLSVAAVGLGQRGARGSQLLADSLPHGFCIATGEPAGGGLFVDERPFRSERTRLADILKI